MRVKGHVVLAAARGVEDHVALLRVAQGAPAGAVDFQDNVVEQRGGNEVRFAVGGALVDPKVGVGARAGQLIDPNILRSFTGMNLRPA